MAHLLEKVQVNIPFGMLQEGYLSVFLNDRLNPEIGFDAASLDGASAEEVQKAATALHEAGLSVTVHGPFMDLSPGSPDPAVRSLTRRRFEQLVGRAAVLEPKTVVCHAGYDGRRYGFMKESWLERSVEMWAWLADRLMAHRVQLVLENVYEDGPDDLLPLLERLEEKNVGFCLDAGHQSAFGKASLLEWVDALWPYLREVHLHDNDGGQDDHLAMGKGNIDFPPLFERLKRLEGPLTVTLEPHRDEDLWPSLDYLKGLWPW